MYVCMYVCMHVYRYKCMYVCLPLTPSDLLMPGASRLIKYSNTYRLGCIMCTVCSGYEGIAAAFVHGMVGEVPKAS